MRIEHLEEIIDLAESLNFTKTSERFYITQPVLSKHVKGVEQELDIRIFLRDQHRVRLTEVGRQFVEDAKKVVYAYHEMVNNVERYRDGVSGKIAVGFLLGAARRLVSGVYANFTADNPQLELDYHAYELFEIYDALFKNQVDLIITLDQNIFSEEEFNREFLYDDEYYAVVAESHPLANLKTIAPSDLAGYRVLFPVKHVLPHYAQVQHKYLSPDQNNIIVKECVRDINTIPIMLDTEECVGITMGHLRDYYKRDDYIFIPLEHYPEKVRVVAVWKKGSNKGHIVDFVEQLKEKQKELGFPNLRATT